jgi:hypothetical protein
MFKHIAAKVFSMKIVGTPTTKNGIKKSVIIAQTPVSIIG